MSKVKFVTYGEHTILVYDSALGVFLKHLIDAAEASPQIHTEWLSNIVSDWRVSACIQDIGINVKERWSTPQCDTFVELTEKACRTLGARASISAEEISGWRILDDNRISTRGAAEILTAPIVELGGAMIALVKGNLPAAPLGTAWLYGGETGRQVLSLRF